ncbi:MAG: hypothetical protein JWO82_2735, partial [Akkermansiaceae bacterium]|nr:hypothetical protein [Akkermansiaceae bacterium]
MKHRVVVRQKRIAPFFLRWFEDG